MHYGAATSAGSTDVSLRACVYTAACAIHFDKLRSNNCLQKQNNALSNAANSECQYTRTKTGERASLK